VKSAAATAAPLTTRTAGNQGLHCSQPQKIEQPPSGGFFYACPMVHLKAGVIFSFTNVSGFPGQSANPMLIPDGV
jgi:hypothetical protein